MKFNLTSSRSKHRVSVIFIMLGDKCNFSCKYCMQHDTLFIPDQPEISEEFFTYLDNAPSGIRFSFFGGEPLLYWPTIVKIVDRYKNKFNYGIITNGSLMTQEMVDYINRNKIGVGLSNEGVSSATCRDFDVLADEHLLSLYRQINGLNISGVLHSKSYALDQILKRLDNKFDRTVMYNADLIMNTGKLPDWLEDFTEAKEYLPAMFTRWKEQLDSNSPELTMTEKNYIGSMLGKMKSLLNKTNYENSPRCGCTGSMLNLGLDGKVYLCHNDTDVIGTIDRHAETYNAYKDYVTLPTRCNTCKARFICGGPCMLVERKEKSDKYCEFQNFLFDCVESTLLK